MVARSARLKVPPDRLDEVTRALQEMLLPAYQRMPGFQYFIAAVSEDCEVFGMSMWTDAEAMEAAADESRRLRREVAGEGDLEDFVGERFWRVLIGAGPES